MIIRNERSRGYRRASRNDIPNQAVIITTLSLAYTVRGELLSETDALGRSTSFTYDATGRLATRTDPLGHVTRFDYDSSDRLSAETRCDGEINILTGYAYDANSNRTSITVFNPATQANNAVYRHHYTQASQLERIENPSGRSESWTYNAFGELETHTDANGKVQTNSYDSLGRLRFELHGAPFNVSIERRYDGAGNLRFISDGITAIDDGFDPLNRRDSSSWTVNGTFFKAVSYAHDNAGNRTTMTDPEGALHTYGYDVDNRPSTLSRGGVLFATLGYDLGGRRKSVALKNGARTEYGFNTRDETTRVRTAASSGQVLASYAYEYNDRGERTVLSREHLGERVDFAYDCAARLMGEVSSGNSGNFVCRNFFETTPGGNESADSNVAGATPRASTIALAIPPRALSWTYDNAGNRTAQTVGTLSTSYQYDADNRLVREIVGAAITDYAYDANGNQISRIRGGVTETFAYDYANRLVGYTSSAGAAFSYGYAPTGERLRKTNLTTLVTEWFMYDGADVVTDYTQSGSDPLALQTSYVQSLSIDSKIARISASGEEHFYVPDALGSVTHLLDSTAAIVNSEVTDAWGNVVASSNTVPERYGYSHRERDPEAGLMHFRARSYDPRLGRFIQTEPLIRQRVSLHYAYVGNDPVSATDPSGHEIRLSTGSKGRKEFNVISNHLSGSALGWGFNPQTGETFILDDQTVNLNSLPLNAAALYAAIKSEKVYRGSDDVWRTIRQDFETEFLPEFQRGLSAYLGGNIVFESLDEAEQARAVLAQHGDEISTDKDLYAHLYTYNIKTGGPTGRYLARLGVQMYAEQAAANTTGRALGAATSFAARRIVSARITRALSRLREGHSAGVRVVASDAELNSLFNQLSAGGKAVPGTTYPGKLLRLSDGSTVGLRGGSTSGGPTIDIFLYRRRDHWMRGRRPRRGWGPMAAPSVQTPEDSGRL